jgi:hypothetical protein
LCLSLGILVPRLEGQQIAAHWSNAIDDIDQELRNGEWAVAEKRSSRLARKILDEADRGEEEAYSLAVVTLLRAIAEAGLGRSYDAASHWDMALNLFPQLANFNLAPYGDAAAPFKGRVLRNPNQFGPPAGWTGKPPVRGNASRPKLIATPRPRFPVLERMGTKAQVILSIIIGADGKTHFPVIRAVEGDDGTSLRYAALDTLRRWRFEPARLRGKPVAVHYTMTVGYHSQL